MRRASALAVALVLTFAAAAPAAAGTDTVTGGYSYTLGGGVISSVSLGAHAGDPATGVVSYENTVGGWFVGTVSCFVTDGSDAWIAGSITDGNVLTELGLDGWAVRVHDGGTPGSKGDTAITLVDELDFVARYCEKASTRFDRWMVPVIEGNLVIH